MFDVRCVSMKFNTTIRSDFDLKNYPMKLTAMRRAGQPRAARTVSIARGLVLLLALPALLAFTFVKATAQTTGYQKPPQAVLDVLNAPLTPTASISPSRDYMALIEGVRYPPIAELAQPMLRLAGLRINPNTNGQYRAPYGVKMWLKKIADASEMSIALPPNAQVSLPQWSADGKHFAFTNTTPTGIELWVGETATGKVRKLDNVAVGAAFGEPFQWMPDARTLLVQLVPANRKTAPAPSSVPGAPNVQESSGKSGPVTTYQDLLKNPLDEDLFDYYATVQLARVDAMSGKDYRAWAACYFRFD